MQLGFVIDQTRCIGCHACTVACKAENHVPLGNFRTWVKYTEEGEFPAVKRSFAVLRCNQCTAAPCVTICPVRALEKRPDGIVDVDPKACIGCKACMQGCPYDALYLNDELGTAQKCHFCAHRTERGLAPACAIVCPTEAIIPGDFDDPDSLVSKLRREHALSARKIEAATGPNVFYREVAEAGIDPLVTSAAGGYLWADRLPSVRVESEEFLAETRAIEERARARTTYDVDHKIYWGWKITAYLFAKSLAAGAFIMAGLLGLPPVASGGSLAERVAAPLAGIFFLALTSVLLVADLKRPERFLYILLRPNWDSWLVRGTWALIAYGGLLATWSAIALVGAELAPAARWMLFGATAIAGGLAACYTGWLFGQAKGRVLWMRRGLWAHLLVQAALAGTAFLVLLGVVVDFGSSARDALVSAFQWILGLQALFILVEGRLAPRKREEEYARAHELVVRGPFARKHWGFGVFVGIMVPLALLLVPGMETFAPVAALLALVGLWVEEDVLVGAGQALRIS